MSNFIKLSLLCCLCIVFEISADVSGKLLQTVQTLKLIKQKTPSGTSGDDTHGPEASHTDTTPTIEGLTPEEVEQVLDHFAGNTPAMMGLVMQYLTAQGMIPGADITKRLKAARTLFDYIKAHPRTAPKHSGPQPWTISNIGSKQTALHQALEANRSLTEFEGRPISQSLKDKILDEIDNPAAEPTNSETVESFDTLFTEVSLDQQALVLKDIVTFNITPPKFTVEQDDDDDSDDSDSDSDDDW